MRRCVWGLSVGLALAVVGCGGGGSSPSGGGEVSFRYVTDWTKSGQPGGGQSQRLTLLDRDGRTVRTFAINRPGPTTQTQEFPGLTPGTYRLRSELYSLPDLQGVKTGELSSWIDLGTTGQLLTTVGSAVTSMRVTPATLTLDAPSSFALAAAGAADDQRLTFVAPNTLEWSTLGTIGTVSSQGVLVTSTGGTGSARARHLPTNQVASTTVTVNAPQTTRTKWTIFVYLNAANDLYQYSDLNVNQMESVTSGDVRFVVQWKQFQNRYGASSFDGTRRYLIRPDNSGSVVSPIVQDLGAGVDMGQPETLAAFLDWGLQFYPADRYGVIVWNHGNGWRRKPIKSDPKAVSYDDETNNAIQTWELNAALGNRKFDFIAWDASLMQMSEVAFEVRERADFVIGSQESPPGEGYPYDRIFSVFRDRPNDSTANLTRAFVDGMLAVPVYANRKITQSVVDTSKLSNLATAIDQLAAELLTHNNDLQAVIPTVRQQAQSYSQATSPPRYYRDLIDVAQRIKAGTTIVSVQQACDAVVSAARSAIVYEGHNANSPGSNGLSIDFTPGNVFRSSSTDYARMQLGASTRWDDWLVVSPP